MAAFAAASSLAAGSPALAQTAGSATGQQDMPDLVPPAIGCVRSLGMNALPGADPAALATTEIKAPPGTGPSSTMVTPGIDPQTIEAMYPEPMRDRPRQPR